MDFTLYEKKNQQNKTKTPQIFGGMIFGEISVELCFLLLLFLLNFFLCKIVEPVKEKKDRRREKTGPDLEYLHKMAYAHAHIARKHPAPAHARACDAR